MRSAKDLVPILQGVAATLTGIAPPTAPKAGDTGGPGGMALPATIQAHDETNSLIISAPPAVFRSLASVVRQLDVRRAQVLIEAVIAEVVGPDRERDRRAVAAAVPEKLRRQHRRQRDRRHQLHRPFAGQQHLSGRAESARRRQRVQSRLHQRHRAHRQPDDFPARRAGHRAARRRHVEHAFDAFDLDAGQPGSRDPRRAGSAVPDRPIHDRRDQHDQLPTRPAASPIRSRPSSARTSASSSR